MDPDMMAAVLAQEQMTGPQMPAEEMDMDPAVLEGMMDTGMAPTAADMPVMQEQMMAPQIGADLPSAVDALAAFMDEARAMELRRKQEAEALALAEQIKGEYAMAAQVLMEKARAMSESVDAPGGPVAGPGYDMPADAAAYGMM